MFTRKAKLTTAAFVFILALSGASFGFLMGRSQQLKASAADTSEQIQVVTQQVKSSGAVLVKGFDFAKRLLVK